MTDPAVLSRTVTVLSTWLGGLAAVVPSELRAGFDAELAGLVAAVDQFLSRDGAGNWVALTAADVAAVHQIVVALDAMWPRVNARISVAARQSAYNALARIYTAIAREINALQLTIPELTTRTALGNEVMAWKRAVPMPMDTPTYADKSSNLADFYRRAVELRHDAQVRLAGVGLQGHGAPGLAPGVLTVAAPAQPSSSGASDGSWRSTLLAAAPMPTSVGLSTVVYRPFTPQWTVVPWLTTTRMHPELLFHYDLKPPGTGADPTTATVANASTSWFQNQFQNQAGSVPVVGQYVLATFLPDGMVDGPASWPGVSGVPEGLTLGGLKGEFLAGALKIVDVSSDGKRVTAQWMPNPTFAHQKHVTADQAQRVAEQLRRAAGLDAVEVVEAPLDPKSIGAGIGMRSNEVLDLLPWPFPSHGQQTAGGGKPRPAARVPATARRRGVGQVRPGARAGRASGVPRIHQSDLREHRPHSLRRCVAPAGAAAHRFLPRVGARGTGHLRGGRAARRAG